MKIIDKGSVPEWSKGMGCKPIGASLRWFDSNPAHISSFYHSADGGQVSSNMADREIFVCSSLSPNHTIKKDQNAIRHPPQGVACATLWDFSSNSFINSRIVQK
jgi:hypothetical protein